MLSARVFCTFFLPLLRARRTTLEGECGFHSFRQQGCSTLLLCDDITPEGETVGRAGGCGGRRGGGEGGGGGVIIRTHPMHPMVIGR